MDNRLIAVGVNENKCLKFKDTEKNLIALGESKQNILNLRMPSKFFRKQKLKTTFLFVDLCGTVIHF